MENEIFEPSHFYLDNGCRVIHFANCNSSKQQIDEWLEGRNLITLSYHEKILQTLQNTLFLIYKSSNNNVLCIHVCEGEIELKWLMNVRNVENEIHFTEKHPDPVDKALGCVVVHEQKHDDYIQFNLQILLKQHEPDMQAQKNELQQWVCGRKIQSVEDDQLGPEYSMILIYTFLCQNMAKFVEKSYYVVRDANYNFYVIIKHH